MRRNTPREWIPTELVREGDQLAHKLSDTPWTYTTVTGWSDRLLKLSRFGSGLADITHRTYTVTGAPWWVRVDNMELTHDLNGEALVLRRYNTMHYHSVNGPNGDIEDIITLCSDSCHQEYDARNDLEYEGWSGAHEGGEDNEYCANCGVIVSCGENACEHQRDNVVVNRFTTAEGEMCEHGNWIQLPERMLG